jgi:hypothetical protein
LHFGGTPALPGRNNSFPCRKGSSSVSSSDLAATVAHNCIWFYTNRREKIDQSNLDGSTQRL